MEDQLRALEQKIQDQTQKYDDQSVKLQDQSKKIDDLMNVIMELKDKLSDSSAEGSRTGGREVNTPKSFGYNPKLSFPKFDGNNCRLWVKKCHKYFRLCKISDDQKVDLASLNMTDKAEKWVTSYLSSRSNVEWPEFVLDLAARFKDDRGVNFVQKFNKLEQTDSIESYLDEFEDLKSDVLETHHSLSDEFILDSFIGGLKPGIKPFVKAFKPATLSAAVEFARLQEEALAATQTPKPYKPISSFPYKPLQAIPLNSNKPPLLPTPSIKPNLSLTKFQPKTTKILDTYLLM